MFPDKVKIALREDGYLRPVAHTPLTAEENGKLFDICPGALIQHESQQTNYHPHWGPLVEVRTGHAVDPTTRHEGSSGGVLSGLLIHLLESKQVDFVAHVKAASDDPLGNELSISRTREDVLAGAGSRYAPSAPLAKLAVLLALPGRFAFVGKPCDVAALRRYEKLNPGVSDKVPFMLSFMCAGIPSRKGTLAILDKFGVPPEQVKSFAYRGDGWPGKTTAITQDNQRFETDYSTSWGTVLNRHLQFRCKICPDGTGEFADVVGADAWYGKDGYPDFAEREGRSLVLSRTSKGEALVQSAKAANAIATEPLAVEEIAKMQPYQLNRKRLVLSRIAALWLTRRPAPRYAHFPLFRLATQLSLRENISSFKGTLRRLIA
ncbi:Coenzyme F420 hydrogenase/dehydrogenase, beta subunit C-terminal domain [uncultured Rhodoferax sp.]|uniref:Coenzyme F420 hydrogenase/dehydrogenase, beta subunit C-terminal domain n=1 Tax=uncultured Rhodoferax sp. TaxID=223188 RepID=UPI0025E49850|nr:Coenzyme F420 hydrogenase/dehydrogenase, beta subunit C-terminal domain [uncultured Rhodoferax sp.]